MTRLVHVGGVKYMYRTTGSFCKLNRSGYVWAWPLGNSLQSRTL